MSIDMDMNDFFTSNYYNANNVPDGVLIEEVIANVVRKEFEENGVATTKAVIRLDSGKAIVLNQTRLGALVGGFGHNPNNWLGKTIIVRRGSTMYQGRPAACVEVQPVVAPRLEGGTAPATIEGPKSSPSGAAAEPPAEAPPPRGARGRTTITSGRKKNLGGAPVHEDLEARWPDLKPDLDDGLDSLPFDK